jgi:hypothetical protein
MTETEKWEKASGKMKMLKQIYYDIKSSNSVSFGKERKGK